MGRESKSVKSVERPSCPAPLTLAQLKKKTQLPQDLLLMGIGWLAREDKLQFSGTSDAIEVALR